MFERFKSAIAVGFRATMLLATACMSMNAPTVEGPFPVPTEKSPDGLVPSSLPQSETDALQPSSLPTPTLVSSPSSEPIPLPVSSPSSEPTPSPSPHPISTPRPMPTPASGLASWAVETWAGSGATGSSDAGRLGATFEEPAGLALGTDGTLFLSDHKARTIRRIDPDGQVHTVAGPDALQGPRGIALAPAGQLYVCDTDSHRVLEVSQGGAIRVVAGAAGIGYQDGSAAIAKFDGPCGIAVRPDGRVVIADHFNERIREIGTDGVVASLSPGRTVGNAFSLHGPNSVAVRPDGSIIVLERIMGRLSLLAPDKTVSPWVGGGYPTYADGTGSSAGFFEPSKIALAPDGRLFVGDAGNHRVRVVEQDGRVWTLAGSGAVGFAGGGIVDGPASEARFNKPMGVVVGADGSLFVADSGNHRIRRLYPVGR